MRLVAKFRVGLGFGQRHQPSSGSLRQTCCVSIAAGLPIAIAGELIRIWASGHLNKSREVTRSGPYRFVAHPLYLGSSLIGAGLAIGSGSLVVVAIVAAYLLLTLTAAIKNEEAFLREEFGGAYDEYRVKRVVDHERPFSWPRAVGNREYQAVIGVVIALLLLVWKATYNGSF